LKERSSKSHPVQPKCNRKDSIPKLSLFAFPPITLNPNQINSIKLNLSKE
jgi:hypothetical protein